MGQGFPIRQVLVVLLAIPSLALSFFVYHTGNALIALVLLVVACFGVYICPSLFARGHEILQPASLAFSSATRWPLFRASVPQETVFLVARVGAQPAVTAGFSAAFCANSFTRAAQVARDDLRMVRSRRSNRG